MKKIVISTILSCLVLLGGALTIGNWADAKSFFGHNEDLKSAVDKTRKSDFVTEIRSELEKEGYHSAGYIIVGQSKKKSEVTIQISKKEYDGKQTDDNLKKIVNRIAKENHLRSFLVKVKTVES